jgi:hypothetical protein
MESRSRSWLGCRFALCRTRLKSLVNTFFLNRSWLHDGWWEARPLKVLSLSSIQPPPVKELTVRAGDSSAFVSIYRSSTTTTTKRGCSDALVISSADLYPSRWFLFELAGGGSATKAKGGERKTASWNHSMDVAGYKLDLCFRYLL